jgi:hypothetical protein
MTDSSTPKAPGRGGENTLNLIGAIAGLAGNLLLGPEGVGVDFGAPFKAGAQMMKDKREQQSLLELLSSNPHTAPLVQHGSNIAASGGLLNNPDSINHPEIQNYLASQGLVPYPQTPATPQTNLMTALQPSDPMASTPPSDYTSQDFLMRAAALRPDIAQKIIVEKATKEPANALKEQLQTILLGKQIAGFETPEERRAAQLADRQTMMEQTDRLIQDRQEKNQVRQSELGKQEKRETWTPKEDESYNNLNNSIDMGRALLGKINSGASPSMLTALMGGTDIGQGVLQRLAPDTAETMQQIQTLRELTGKVMSDVKAQSGAQYSAKELQWMQSSLPSKWDTPEQLKYSLASDVIKKQWVAMNAIAAKVEKAGNLNPAMERGISPEQLRAFSALKKQLKENSKTSAQSIFENKQNLPYLQTLGMDYLIMK